MSNLIPDLQESNPQKYAYKRWLRMAVDRLALPQKALYMEIGVDQSTWSRWLDYHRDQELPGHLLPRVLALLDAEARHDLDDLLSSPKTLNPGATRG